MPARPANSGCATSTPESTIVIGLPGPGGVRPTTPIAARHHSVPIEWIGEVGHAHGPGDGVRRREAEGVAGADAWQHPRGGVSLEPVEP